MVRSRGADRGALVVDSRWDMTGIVPVGADGHQGHDTQYDLLTVLLILVS